MTTVNRSSRAALAEQVGARQAGIAWQPAASAEHRAAGGVTPVPSERGQSQDGAHCVGPARGTLHAVVETDGGGSGQAVSKRQRFDGGDGYVAPSGGARGRPPRCLNEKSFCAAGVMFQIIAIEQAIALQHMGDGIGQRGVTAGPHGKMVMALFSAVATVGIDGPELRALAFGALDHTPQMQVAGDGIGPPQHDQARIFKRFRVHAKSGAHALLHCLRTGTGADGAVQQTGTERMEQTAGHAFPLHLPHRSSITVGQDGLRFAAPDSGQPVGDESIRLLPRDRREAARTFPARALEGLKQARGVMNTLGVAAHLGAQHAVRQGMGCITLDVDDSSVLHGDTQGAGIGAIVRAGSLDFTVTQGRLGPVLQTGENVFRAHGISLSSHCRQQYTVAFLERATALQFRQ